MSDSHQLTLNQSLSEKLVLLLIISIWWIIMIKIDVNGFEWNDHFTSRPCVFRLNSKKCESKYSFFIELFPVDSNSCEFRLIFIIDVLQTCAGLCKKRIEKSLSSINQTSFLIFFFHLLDFSIQTLVYGNDEYIIPKRQFRDANRMQFMQFHQSAIR